MYTYVYLFRKERNRADRDREGWRAHLLLGGCDLARIKVNTERCKGETEEVSV